MNANLDDLIKDAERNALKGSFSDLTGEEALELLTELKGYREQHAQLGKMLGYEGDLPSMKDLLAQVGEEFADFAALSAEVQSIPKGIDPSDLIQRAWSLRDLAKKLSGRSVVLEIAEINAHE